MAVKKGSQFTAGYKWLQCDFLGRMTWSQNTVVGALEMVGKAFKLAAAGVKKCVSA